jgi:predicted dehydrogenase
VQAKGHTPKIYFGQQDLWRTMLTEVKPDMVVIATPWEVHAPMGVAAMKAGAHAFIETPIAVTLDQMWQLVNTSEETGRHCMHMENVCYGREELLYLNMVRQGVIGELLHGEAAYIHDLREQMNEVERGTGSWRTYHYARRNGNLYPCHGLGPVAQYMNLGRTEDAPGRLSSFSSPAKARALYGKAKFPADHKWNRLSFTAGDINTSIIKTALGRTIMVQWDEQSPRPYSRLNLIQGTKGTLAGYPNRLAIEGVNTPHSWAQGEEWEKLVAQYEHPLFKRVGELAKKMGGHGGMDFLMLYRMVECLRTGQPLDQNVYEGCFWSSVGPLSEKSVKENGAPQDFPDFTRGNWKTTKPLSVIA